MAPSSPYYPQHKREEEHVGTDGIGDQYSSLSFTTRLESNKLLGEGRSYGKDSQTRCRLRDM